MNTLRVAVVGVGVMGTHYARIVDQLRGVELVAVCGRSRAPVERLAGELGVAGFADEAVEAMLRSHAPVDAVIIATPEDAHLAPARAALAAGAHILVEKPLAGNASGAAEIVELAARHDRQLMVCHHLRFDPRYHELARAVRAGTVGTVVNVSARRNPAATSATRIGGRVPAAYWIGVHDIDLVHWITGQRVVKVVSRATGRSLAHLGVDDCVVSTMTLADGALFVLENSWATPVTQGNPRSFALAVRGTAGVGEVEAYEHGLAIYTEHSMPALGAEVMFFPHVHGRYVGMYRDMIEHFLDCVTGGGTPAVTGDDGWAAVKVADAIVESLATGQEIEVAW
jgi:predicted dehydrogenase